MIVSKARIFTDRSATGTVVGTVSVPISTVGAGTVSFGVSGTWTGALAFEATIDGTTWLPAPSTQILPNGLAQSGATGNGQWSLNVAGFNAFRVKGGTITSGAASIYLDASQASTGIQAVVVVSNAGPTLNHNEVVMVASGVEAQLISMTAVSNSIRIQKIEVSGENVALFRVKINGSTVSNKRSWHGNFNQTFDYDGLVIPVGQTLTVTAYHTRPNLSSFEATVLSS